MCSFGNYCLVCVRSLIHREYPLMARKLYSSWLLILFFIVAIFLPLIDIPCNGMPDSFYNHFVLGLPFYVIHGWGRIEFIQYILRLIYLNFAECEHGFVMNAKHFSVLAWQFFSPSHTVQIKIERLNREKANKNKEFSRQEKNTVQRRHIYKSNAVLMFVFYSLNHTFSQVVLSRFSISLLLCIIAKHQTSTSV